jgi:hypothetical protein
MVVCNNTICNKKAFFNYIGEKPISCKTHKLPTMVDVLNKKCLECSKIPLFNFKDVKGGIYCNSHKKENMVNVTHRMCLEKDCNKQASFNIKGKFAEYCGSHKTEAMISVSHSICKAENCIKWACYKSKDSKKCEYCDEHKKDEMTYLAVTKKCNVVNCCARARYNHKNNKDTLYCAKHKLKDMIYVNCVCVEKDCLILANYNLEGHKPLYCVKHKSLNMVDVRSKKCITAMCGLTVGKKYEGYCLRCFIYTFPEKPITINYKTKESAVVQYILKEFPNCSWTADRRVENGCSKRRPDLIIDLGYQVIIIEIDEDGHKDYDCSCENKRIMELSRDVGHRPIVFIRFNPDGYERYGKKITSSWGINEKGLCSIKKNKEKEWSSRLLTLKSQVQYWLETNNKTNKTVEVIQLFY